MKVVCDKPAELSIPGRVPTTLRRSHGIAPVATIEGSVTVAMARAHAALLSNALCQVGRAMASSAGLGLRKWVATCTLISRPGQWIGTNNVACGPKKLQTIPVPEVDGRQI